MNSSSNRITQWLEQYYRPVQVLAVVVIFVIGWFALLWPQYLHLNDSGVFNYQATLETLQHHQRYLTDLKNMSERYNTIDQRVFMALNQLVPPERDHEFLYADIEQLLADSPFTVQSINVAAAAIPDQTTATPTLPSTIKALTISVNVSTEAFTYLDFKALLTKIEQNNQLLNLESVNFSPSNTSFSLVFTTYEHI